MTKLVELYLSQNFIEKIENLESLVNLEILDLAHNKISVIENLGNLKKLKDLWLNNNLIKNFGDLSHISNLTELTCIYLWKNPVADFPSYKRSLKELCPTLSQIDTSYI